MDKLVCHTQHSQPVHQKYVHIFITKLHFHHNAFIRKYILCLKINTYTRLTTEDSPQKLTEDTGHKD